MSEVWKPIPSAPGWFASSLGRIRCDGRDVKMPNGGVKKLIVPPTFGVFDAKKQRFKQSILNRTRWVAPLICEAFNGPRPEGKTDCMHLDEDSKNNVPTNLAWGTHAQNSQAPKYVAQRREFMLRLWAERKEQPCQERF